MEYYSATKTNDIWPLVTIWMDLKVIMLSEISQRKTNIIWFSLYVDSKEQKMKKENWKRLMDTERELEVARGEGEWGTAKKWRDQEARIGSYKIVTGK